jgi:chemotaxis protein MotB
LRKDLTSARRTRRTEIEEIDAEGSWAISYGDMVTLLLTFFILFFNVSQKSTDDLKRVQTAILTQLGANTSDQAMNKGAEEPRLNIGRKPDSVEVDEEIVKPWGGKAYAYGNRILIEFPEKSFFDFGKTELNSEGRKVLSKMVPTYLPFAGKNILSIKAFTDNVKVDKAKSKQLGRKYEDNLELSALRAVAAMRVLQSAGIPLNRMRISGYGESDGAIRTLAESKTDTKVLPASKGSPLARKVVLLIEPMTKEQL